MKTVATIMFVSAAVLLAGCGGPSQQGGPSGPTPDQTATDVAEMLKEYTDANKRGPNSLADLTDAQASHPVGHAAVMSKEYVVIWKTPVSAAGGDSVLAHPKDAATAGGKVVMGDGSVKQMTADEFKAASKGKK